MEKSRIAILASGNGTNAEAIIRYFQNHPRIEVGLVLSNNPKAFVLDRAKNLSVPAVTFTREDFKSETQFLPILRERQISHIVLAGFLWLIPEYLIHAFPDKIINIHPALLPKYGGKGMYGMKVHEAVKSAADKETGITIHLVNAHYDEGKILFQASCPVEETHSPGQIAECVHKLEHEHYPLVIERWIIDAEG